MVFSVIPVFKYETLDFNGHVPKKGRGGRAEMKACYSDCSGH